MPSPVADDGPDEAELKRLFSELRSGLCGDLDGIVRAALREELLDRLGSAEAAAAAVRGVGTSGGERSPTLKQGLKRDNSTASIHSAVGEAAGIFKGSVTGSMELQVDQFVQNAIGEGERALTDTEGTDTEGEAFEFVSMQPSQEPSPRRKVAMSPAKRMGRQVESQTTLGKATEALKRIAGQDEESFGLLARHRRGYLAGKELYESDMVAAVSSDTKRKVQTFRRTSSVVRGRTIEFNIEPSIKKRGSVGAVIRICEVFLECLQRFVCTYYFDTILAVVVFANVLIIGIEADFATRRWWSDGPAYFHTADRVFCAIFTTELLLRVWAYGFREFSMGHTRSWNFLDFFLLLFQYGEIFVSDFISRPGDDLGNELRALGFWRIIRFARLLRIVRMLRGVTELRTIVVSIIGTFRTLAWTMVLLALVIYTCAVFMLQIVSSFLGSLGDAERESLSRHWGSLPQAMLVLFQAISNGVDWESILYPLMEHISPWLAIPVCLYIGFGIFALMNIITGMFVESAMESAKKEHERFLLHTVQKLFKTTDDDQSGEISWKEFESKLDHPDMHMYFRSIDVDVDEAEDLFKLVDIDNSGTIDPEEFVNGCIRLQGPAKAIDLATLMHEYHRREKRDFARHKCIAQALVLLLRSSKILASVSGAGMKEESYDTPDEDHLQPLPVRADRR